MHTKGLVGSVVITLAALAAAGCSSSTRIAARVPDPSMNATRSSQAPSASSVNVDDAIARACNLPTPHFDFDSSNVRQAADPRLDKIAECFTRGPLAGRKMDVIGHADPRGGTEYNFALGQRRAGSIASYIEAHGVRSNQVATTSRGELDATGTSEAGWALDRRVDMRLAD